MRWDWGSRHRNAIVTFTFAQHMKTVECRVLTNRNNSTACTLQERIDHLEALVRSLVRKQQYKNSVSATGNSSSSEAATATMRTTWPHKSTRTRVIIRRK
jgi:hypothetical protein